MIEQLKAKQKDEKFSLEYRISENFIEDYNSFKKSDQSCNYWAILPEKDGSLMYCTRGNTLKVPYEVRRLENNDFSTSNSYWAHYGFGSTLNYLLFSNGSETK